ncbi:MAG: SH3 domain-containing protein [bacterium]|nr:SH3 domain-containing protein [bacterium]
MMLTAAFGMTPFSPLAAQSTPTPLPEVLIPAVVYQTTNLRQGPDTRFDILGRLAQDDIVQVFERESDAAQWLHVISETGTSGWIPGFSAALEPGRSVDELPIFQAAIPNPNVQGDVTVIAYGRVNVRSGPAIEYESTGTLDVNDRAVAVARSSTLNDWLFIEHETIEGWVAFFTVQVEGDPNTLPVRVPDSQGEMLVSPSQVLRARFNIRLHTEPVRESETIRVIPFNSRVTLLARTDDAVWLYVDFEGTAGWGAANLFSTPPDLSLIPVYTPLFDAAEPEAEMPELTDVPETTETPIP